MWLWPWVALATAVVLAGVVGSTFVAASVAARDVEKTRQAFRASSADIATTLGLAIQHEEDLVVNGAAFIAANPNASNTQFVQWAKSVRAMQRYPELQGVGEVVIVNDAQLDRFGARVISDPPHPLPASGKFEVVPPGHRPFYCFSSASESRTAEGVPAGLDFCASNVSSLRARDAGVGSYEPFPVGPNTWLGVESPIYRGGVVPATLQRRRSQFLGWLGVSVVPSVVLENALKGHPNIAVEMRYHRGLSTATFHQGTASRGAQSLTVDLHNGWTVRTFGVRLTGGVFANGGAIAVLLAGLALSGSLGALVFVLATSRRRALALVDRQTAELRGQAEQIKRAAEQTKRSERRFRSLVQNSSDLTLVCTAEGTLSYVSASSERVLGTESSRLLGTPIADLVDSADWDLLAEQLDQSGARQGVLVCRVTHADGEPRWVEATASDLQDDFTAGGTVLNLRDITDRRQLETELRHAQKLETVGQLAAGIAHEINTPIQFIGSNVIFLQQAFTDLTRVVDAYRLVPESASQQDALTHASATDAASDTQFLSEEIPVTFTETLAGVERVRTIVAAMKAFGQPSSSETAPADLNEAIRSTLVVANSQLQQSAEVITELGDLPLVQCHVGDINQVLLNLLINAAHAIEPPAAEDGPRGTITVRSRRDGDEVVVEVADSGVGIADDIADRVFDPFFTTKEVGSGTGQGLAIAHSLIHDRHAGSITFTSEPGVGTTFSVRLPIKGPHRARSIAQSTQPELEGDRTGSGSL
jgi:PAS domain S-box-containing protein